MNTVQLQDIFVTKCPVCGTTWPVELQIVDEKPVTLVIGKHLSTVKVTCEGSEAIPTEAIRKL